MLKSQIFSGFEVDEFGVMVKGVSEIGKWDPDFRSRRIIMMGYVHPYSSILSREQIEYHFDLCKQQGWLKSDIFSSVMNWHAHARVLRGSKRKKSKSPHER